MERTTLEALREILDALGIRWVLIGALAANRYRVTARLTQDVDLLLSDAGAGLGALERALGEAGWSVRRASPGGEILRLRHPEHGPADLIRAGTDYERQALARARREALAPGGDVLVLAPEDVVVMKLVAGRAQDVADVEAILAAKVPLDESYVEAWAEAWGVLESWNGIRRGRPEEESR